MNYAEWGAFLIGSVGVAGFFWLVRSDKLSAGVRALASLCVVGATVVGIWLLTKQSAVPPPPPQVNQPAPTSRPRTSIEEIFPPESAVDIRPVPGTPSLTFFLADWVSWSANNIKLSSWISENGSFARVSSKQYPYLGAGDQTTLTVPISSTGRAIVAICMSYLVNNHQVEVIHFFSNADGTGYRRARDNIFQVDGNGHLCQSMPRPALQALQQ
jgi:hypothetical protein